MSVTGVLFDILVVLLAAKLAAESAERAGLPAVVGEIVAGILIGPSALGLVGSDEVLRTLGELGVILLLFEVGMEMELAELAAVGRASLLVATAGVVVPFAAGFGVSMALGMESTEALFVGAALTATSVGITARVFGDLRALSSIEARTVLGAAVADDVMGLVILTVVVRIATTGGISVAGVAEVVAVAVAFLVVTTAVGIRLAPRLFAFVARVSRSSGTLVAVALAFALAFAELAHAARLAPIVGAFVAGVCMGRTRSAERIRRELTPVGHLFIPVFFLQVGIDAEVGQFTRADVLGLAAALLVVALAGKLIACVGMAGSPGDKLLVGIGMIPRGEVGLIFATIGLREGVFGEDVYGAMLLVVLLTTLLTPPVLRWRLMRRRAADGERTAGAEPPGGWLRLLPDHGGTVELAGDPAPQLALQIGLGAALLGDRHRPGPKLLDWLGGLPDHPLRWDAAARQALFDVLERGGPRAWRFLALTGLLDRALPELGEALVRRQADPFELDPTRAVRWHRLGRLHEVVEDDGSVAHPEIVALAAVLLDAGEDGDRAASIVMARRIAQRLDLGATAQESLAGLVRDAELLVSAAGRPQAFTEEKVLTLAAHLESPEQARALVLLSRAGLDQGDIAGRERLLELHRLIQEVMARPGLTDREASNAVNRRRAEAARLTDDPAVRERIEAAPRAYVLTSPPEDLARQARLCEPPTRDTVRAGIVANADGTWTVDLVAQDSVGLLASEALALAEAGIDVREATLAIWGDRQALGTFRVTGAEDLDLDLLTRHINTGRRRRHVTAPRPEVRMSFDDHGSPWHTLCRVEAPDRSGLLATVAACFAAAGVNVHAARITARDGTAVDEFEITDRYGGKLSEAARTAVRDGLARGVETRNRFARRRTPPARRAGTAVP